MKLFVAIFWFLIGVGVIVDALLHWQWRDANDVIYSILPLGLAALAIISSIAALRDSRLAYLCLFACSAGLLGLVFLAAFVSFGVNRSFPYSRIVSGLSFAIFGALAILNLFVLVALIRRARFKEKIERV